MPRPLIGRLVYSANIKCLSKLFFSLRLLSILSPRYIGTVKWKEARYIDFKLLYKDKFDNCGVDFFSDFFNLIC